jgi:transcriptional regulator with XRE-family HTH domain
MAKKQPKPLDTARERLRQAAKDSGMTQEEIGLRMGLSKGGARQAVSRMLNGDSYDPRLSTLITFAAAINRNLKELF